MLRDVLMTADCLTHLPRLPDKSIDLVFADPPFNIGYEYDEYHDKKEPGEYLAWTDRWLAECVRVLKPTGTMWVAIGDEYAAEMKLALDRAGLHMRNWVIWHYTFGVSCTKKFNRSHAHLFYYVKNPKDFTFNADTVRVPSARQLQYADKRANPKGKLPDDTWVLRPQEPGQHFADDSDSWYIPRVCGTFKERTDHPCQMPEAILERLILATSNPGDMVLDPFAGSGTTLAVAKRLGRRWYGIELSAAYAEAIEERLRTTPMVTPGHAPTKKKSFPRVPGSTHSQPAGLHPRTR